MLNEQPTVLTIDVGLTNCKTTLFDLQTVALGAATCRYSTVTPKPGWSEQDPEDWWQALHSCLGELHRRAILDNVDIRAISIVAHMHGLIAVDRCGQPLTRCWTLWDRRSIEEARELAVLLGAETAYRVTGGRMEPYTPACKIRWLKNHQSELFERVAMFLSPKDYVRIRLGGDWVTDPIDAAGTVLFDLRKKRWSPELVEACGARPDQLPEIRLSWESGGVLGQTAADELSLPAGIPILVGAGDDVEVLGAGVVRPGLALEHLGSTGTMIACTRQPLFDPDQRAEVYPHVLPDLYLVGGATNAAGRSLEWARALLRTGQDLTSFLPLRYPPSEGRPRPPFYLPFIQGERGLMWEPTATGMLLGLREEHTPLDLAAAIYEGVGFSLKGLLEAAQRLGAETREVVSGTPYADPGWAQMRADLYGLPLLFNQAYDPTALGAALLALHAIGAIPGFEAVHASTRPLDRRIDPDPRHTAYCQARFNTYQAVLPHCQPLFSVLSS
jgi:xylulokinase